MNRSEALTAQQQEEVGRWVDRLLAAAGRQKQEAAAELSRLGVWARGSVRTRGSLTAAGANRLPAPDRLPAVVGCLEDADPETRCRVAVALGEWGDEAAAAALCQVLRADGNEEVQLACVAALQTVGGPAAAEGLRGAAERGTEAVRLAALAAIEELATGGRAEDTEGPELPPEGEARAGGQVRTRGAVRTRAGGDLTGRIAATLEGVRADATGPEYLRRRAEEVLGYLRRAVR
jgi:hypothetical protein